MFWFFFLGTLGVYELNESHTSEYISSMFENCLSEWNISQNQIIAVVTDNGKEL